MKILFAGDLHLVWDAQGIFLLEYAMMKTREQFPDCELAIQVGDFGFSSSTFEAAFRNAPKLPYRLLAIDGNHEDHTWLKSTGWGKGWDLKYNMEYMPRGSVIQIDGRHIGFLGGAMNVDRAQHGKTKFGTQNFISNANVKYALTNFNKYNPDLIVTHSCPHGIGIGMAGAACFLPSIQKYVYTPYSLPPTDILDCGEHALKDLWDKLEKKPANWVFGHFHCQHRKVIGNTEFVCVGSTDFTDHHQSFLPIVYDTIDNQITIGDRISYFPQAPDKNEKKAFR